MPSGAALRMSVHAASLPKSAAQRPDKAEGEGHPIKVKTLTDTQLRKRLAASL